MCSEYFINKVLRDMENNINCYRLAYLFSPQPYPSLLLTIPLSKLKHYKWKALYILGKIKKHLFVAARSK